MSIPYRSLIVDDELSARCNLRRLLAPFAPQITIIDEAADGEEALDKIKKLLPDLVFLDIHLPKLDAFEIIERLEKPAPRIIFTTAYDKYAVKAFDVNSLDYLLKPIAAERLGRAVAKLQTANIPETPDVSLLHYTIKEMQKIKMKRIQVKIGEIISFVNLSDVCYFQGEDYLTGVHTNERKYLIEIPLYELETRLLSDEFVRIHRSTIVNVLYVKELRRSLGGKLKVTMKQPRDTELIISRSYAKQIDQLFQCI